MSALDQKQTSANSFDPRLALVTIRNSRIGTDLDRGAAVPGKPAPTENSTCPPPYRGAFIKVWYWLDNRLAGMGAEIIVCAP